MRASNAGDVLEVRAIGGLHVVTLAWDFVEGQEGKKKGLLGFAIERTEFKGDTEVERYFLRGIKRFKFKDEGLAPGTPMPTSEHPIQTFQWGDYTAKPATTYRYKVVPVYGKPKLLELDEASATKVKITTEGEEGPKGSGTRHDIYFNRGAAGSQAYARKFRDTAPDENAPESEQMAWLSRGLFEALTGFIKTAAGPDAKNYKLRAMLYEFRYLPVGKAFAAAAKAGADVAIRYEAKTYKDHNEEMIAKAGIESAMRGAEIAGRDTPQQVHRADPQGQADRGVDRLDQHLGRRHLRPFQPRSRDLGWRDRAALSRLLGSPGRGGCQDSEPQGGQPRSRSDACA